MRPFFERLTLQFSQPHQYTGIQIYLNKIVVTSGRGRNCLILLNRDTSHSDLDDPGALST